MTSGSTAKVFAVVYAYPDDDELINRHRPVHREFLKAEHGEVEILAFGPWADAGTPGALIIVRGPDAAKVTATMDTDPFLLEGVVADRQIREWTQLRSPWSA